MAYLQKACVKLDFELKSLDGKRDRRQLTNGYKTHDTESLVAELREWARALEDGLGEDIFGERE